MESGAIHLKAIRLARPEGAEGFPFSIPALRDLERVEFRTPVTFFVGENGSGKSSLLEAIACATGAITAGSQDAAGDGTLDAVRRLARCLSPSWARRTRRGFFLRAEDFFGYVKRLATLRAGLEGDLREVEQEFRGRGRDALALARMPLLRELRELEQRYGGDLDARSHGESFIQFFQARFVPDGLYLLDEPEAPLSPTRQLTFLALLRQGVAQGAQFIIATHSPILLAFPGATILSFDDPPIRPIPYDQLDHVAVTRAFLANPERFLRHLDG